MGRGPTVYTLPPGTTPQIAGTTIEPAIFNAFADDVANTFNTPQPIEYGGTGAANAADARNNIGAASVGSVPSGNCRFLLDGSNGRLLPFNGNGISIGGAMYSIPSAGVALAPTGLTPATNYFVYAYMNGTTMTLEASATGHSADPTTGVEIKTGDATRTLVGMVRPVTGPAFVDSLTQRFVISWFNRRDIALNITAVADQLTSSTTYTEVNNTFRVNFLSWGQDASTWSLGALATSSVAGVPVYCALRIDNTGPSSISSAATAIPFAGGGANLGSSGVVLASEGYHFICMNMASGSGGSTATVFGSGTVSSAPSNIQGRISG